MSISIAQQIARMNETQLAVHKFQRASYAKYDSYSYSSGYLGSLLGTAMAQLPKAEYDRIMKQLENVTALQLTK